MTSPNTSDIRLWSNTGVSTALELVAHIEARVASGELGAGDRLPSVRAGADALGMAPNTVAAAYRRLRERGVVTGRGRQGSSIAGRTTVAHLPAASLPSGIIDAMSGNPDPALLPQLDHALAAAAAGPRADYRSELVLPQLDIAARRWLADDGIEFERLTLASGAMDAIERVLAQHLRPGDRVGVEDPGHVPVYDLVAAMGLTPVPLTIDNNGIVPAELDARLASGLQCVIVTPRAHNPTGAALTVDRARSLDSVLARHPGVVTIEDDHAGPVSGVPLVGLDHKRIHWALVRSVAKSLGPDLRLAFLVGDAVTIDRVEARLAIGPGWISHLLQATVAELLDDPHAMGTVDRAADTYRRRRERLIDRLADAGVAATGGSGLQVWIPVPEEQPVADALRDAGYAIRVGAAYRRSTPPAVRVTVAGLDDSRIDDLADRLAAAIRPRHSTRSRGV